VASRPLPWGGEQDGSDGRWLGHRLELLGHLLDHFARAALVTEAGARGGEFGLGFGKP
jgi:hypothetical protein